MLRRLRLLFGNNCGGGAANAHPGSDLLLEDGTSLLLQEDGTSTILTEQ